MTTSPYVHSFNDQNFESEVLQSPIPVMVYCYTDWSTPCKALFPVIDGIARDYQGKITVGTLNIDISYDTSMKYNLQSVPTVVIFKEGTITGGQHGLAARHKLIQLLAGL